MFTPTGMNSADANSGARLKWSERLEGNFEGNPNKILLSNNYNNKILNEEGPKLVLIMNIFY